MKEIVLNAKPRSVTGKQVKALRRLGELPAVIYGHGQKSLTITLNQHEAALILPGVSTSQLVVINVDGEPHTVLVRERQRHPVKGMLIHLDFQEVSMTEKLRVNVPVELVGESPAAKFLAGVVVQNLEELAIEALPGDLPGRIIVDISGLTEIGSAIHVRDLAEIAGVEILDDADETVVVVTPPFSEAEAKPAEAAPGEPEVMERGKKEDEKF